MSALHLPLPVLTASSACSVLANSKVDNACWDSAPFTFVDSTNQ
jgi:hypothetical protein